MQDLAIDTPPSVAPPKLEPTITQYETLPTLYLDELRAMAVHFGVDPDAGAK